MSRQQAKLDPRYGIAKSPTGIAGLDEIMTRRSQNAIANLNAICSQHLQGHYELEVVDIYQFPRWPRRRRSWRRRPWSSNCRCRLAD